MSMTKKDFIALAEELAHIRPNIIDPLYVEWIICIKAVASACKYNNPNFDREKFIEACNK